MAQERGGGITTSACGFPSRLNEVTTQGSVARAIGDWDDELQARRCRRQRATTAWDGTIRGPRRSIRVTTAGEPRFTRAGRCSSPWCATFSEASVVRAQQAAAEQLRGSEQR
jgi:hypothetical protein